MNDKKKRQRTVIFSDFDGTISARDVGNRLFHHFSNGQSDVIVEKWKTGEITARECLTREADLIRLNEQQFHDFLDSFTLDPGFSRFEQHCRAGSVELHIISDGLNLYIEYLLKKNGFSHLPVLANLARLEEDRMVIEYPYEMGACGICGNCKGDRLREYVNQAEDRPFMIYIGDGFSDRCATKAADWIFAKNDLADYCQSHNISFNSYDTFDDISRAILTSGRFDNNSPEQEGRQ